MNRIYKVIWNKTRGMYMVVSELAKGQSKDGRRAVGRKKVVQTAAALAVFFSIVSMGGTSYAANISIGTATVTDSSGKTVTVFTGNSSAAGAVEAAVELTVPYNSRQIGILQTAVQSVETELAQHQNIIDNLGTDKLTLSSDNTLQKETYDSTTKTTTTTDATGLKVAGPISAESGKITNSLEVGHNANVGGAVNAGSLNSRGNLSVDGNALVKGTLTSQSTINGNEIVSQTNITAKNQVVGMQGVVDNTLTSGNYVTAGNTVGENIVALDTQVKANADQFTTDKTSTALHVSKDGNLIVGTKENQTVKDMKIRGKLTSGSLSTGDITSSGNVSVAGKVEAEAVYDDTTKTGNYVVQTNSVGANLSALDTQVKSNADAIEEEARKRKYSVTNLENADKQLQTNIDNEAAAREAADTALTNRIAAEETDRAEADTALQNAIDKEAADRKAADTTLQTNIDNEAAARKAADDALDSRTTALEDKTEAITYDKDSKTVMVDGKLTATEGITDGTTQDGQYVKADNYVGQNLNALDQGLQAETAARQAADTTLQTNIDNEAKARQDADAALDDKITAETSARVAADTKLVEAVNSGLSLSDDNVLQKNTTAIDAQGNVTTSKTDANEMILNKGKDNQITLNENGIKVGTNSTVVDKDGVYTGGDTYSEAKAAMSADGKIKGANGAFIVDENGNVTSKATITGETVTDGKGASMSNGTVTGKTLTDGIATITNGNINTSGTITGGTVTSTGNISALGDIHAGGAITGASASIQGALTAGSATITGDLIAGGAIQGKSISDGTATMQNGNLTGVKNLSAETITTSGDATIGGDLTVKGKLNVDEIDLTKSGIVGDNNVTASTKVAAGEITSYQKATSTKDGSEKESAIDYDENGTSTWAKATDADGNWKKSTLTVEGSDVTSKVVDSDKNSNESKQTSTESSDVVKDANGNTSTFSQRVKDILQEIKNAAGDTLTKVEQTDTAITSQIGDGSAVKSEMTADGITNTAVGGTITNSAKDLVNTATGDMTNTVGGKMLNDVTGDMENKVGGNLTTTVGGNETHTVEGTLIETVTGKVTEDYKSDLDTKVGGNETHTVGGTLTETVTGDVTEDYKANLSTTVGGNQTTTVTGDSSLTAENINNTASNKITNKALDVETDAASSIVNKVANDAGSNTSTQLSYETKEEMSQADGKTASYLRGAAEEKSQLTDGDKKTTIDTIAGQINTHITDGTNTSNSLQKADQVATSVTDGTNTTVVNQDAKSLASSITDGTKANNTNSTVDKSEQLIKASDTQYNASVKTATASAERLVSGNIIDILKDAENGYVNTTVTSSDGASSTSVQQDNKDISNTAKQGTITNEAKDLVNKAEEKLSNSAAEIENTATTSIKDVVGKSTVTTTDAGTTFENNDHAAAIGEGTITKTTISGNTLETGKATADYVDVNKDLTVKGDSDLQGNATVGKDLNVKGNTQLDGNLDVKGSTKLDGTLEVAGKSTFKDDVTMEKNLDVKGTTTTEELVVKSGATITGGTTTDTLHVTNTATFDGLVTFKDAVSMEKDLTVGGNATVTGDVTAKSYKVSGKTYIDENGINANGQKVTNVADGTIAEGSTDAVNGGQLHQTNQRVATVENRMDGVENRMDRVENRVDNLDNRIDKVGASAAAMANLHPMDFDEDSKVSVAAAMGSYRSETAGALGVFYRPTDRVMMNVSTSFGNGENMIGGGVSFKLGKSSKRLEKAEATNAALAKQVTNLQNRLDALLGVLNPSLSKDFPDVPANHWAYEAVSRLAGNDIVQGYEDGKYHGERTMTRYEMAEIIYNALSKGAKAEAKLVEEFRPELQAMAAQRKA